MSALEAQSLAAGLAVTMRVAGVSSSTMLSEQRTSPSGSRCTHALLGVVARSAARLAVPVGSQLEEENVSVSSSWTAIHGFGSGMRCHSPPLTAAAHTGAMETMHSPSAPTMQS